MNPNKPGATNYVRFLLDTGQPSEFCIRAPSHTNFGVVHDPQFDYRDPNAGGKWATQQEHLHFTGADGGKWATKCHATWRGDRNKWELWFSSGIIGQTDHDGDFPIIIDPDGKQWRIKHPTYDQGDNVTVVLEAVPPVTPPTPPTTPS